MEQQNTLSPLAARAQAFLFAEGGSLTLRRLALLLGVARDDTDPILQELADYLEGSGLSLVRTDDEATLTASVQTSEALRSAYSAEMGRDVGDAGLEVIAILLYHGSCTRAQIDYIRGVNTSSTMRTLMARGLIERTGNPSDGREYKYRPTVELLAHLGVRRFEELPEYARIVGELAAFEAAKSPFTDTNPYGESDNSSHNNSA